MDISELNFYFNKFKYGEDNFHNLMKFRVREILLISTFYDAFTIEQESRLSQQIVGEYHLLNLTTIPRITSVPTGDEALKKIAEHKYDLVITTMRIGQTTPFKLARKIKKLKPDLPVLLLLTVKSDINLLERSPVKSHSIDKVFLWNGDSKIFLAMIKYIEDLKNVAYDTEHGLVRVILLVEDSVNFYSIYLPLLYTKIMNQTQRLIAEELNDVQKYHRMRARPKVLLVKTYEEAVEYYHKYKEYLLCVISDVTYPRKKKLDHTAGIRLINELKKHDLEIPLLLQSSDIQHSALARQINVGFIHKNSPTLLNELDEFILKNLGFGDFIFRDPQGNEIDRVSSIAEMEEKLVTIPLESLLYHSSNNHFSAWLIAHGEIQIARRVRPVKNTDFTDDQDHRHYLINVFKEVDQQRIKGKIINFDVDSLNNDNIIIRLTPGSLGGKGRGVAFLNSLLTTMELEKKFPGVQIKIPLTAIIGTNEYDEFIEHNHLSDILKYKDDQQIKEKFLKGQLTQNLTNHLTRFLKIIKKPLAVRSSGLLEDSQSQPFAGIYQTYMVPNNHPDLSVRIKHLSDAIKLVFASVFLKNSQSYINSLNYRIEDEKMAVIIQEIVGHAYHDRYYPHISGVAQSYNFYPISYMKHHDGIALIAVGLGQTVVEGERNFRFCPKYPEVQFLSNEELFKFNQTKFYALDLSKNNIDLINGDHATLCKNEILEAEKDKTLYHLASVWDPVNNRIVDGLSMPGIRVVNYANILKYDYFPLASILTEFLDIAEKAFGVQVEIEFAVDLYQDARKKILPTFYLLQVRPLTILSEEVHIEIDKIKKEELILYTENGMGHGVNQEIHDVILINPGQFDNNKTIEMQKEIELFNDQFKKLKRDYILIGPGRWGSRDRFLGIPVQWSQINRAKAIIEIGLKDFDIEPSQGTHFFHNLVAMNVGYFNIPYRSQNNWIDLDWLLQQSFQEKGQFFYVLSMDKPFKIIMDGKKGISLIYKPDYS